jgi:hypothetical protein
VISRYFIIASGNLEFSRNCGTIRDGRYSFSFLKGFIIIFPYFKTFKILLAKSGESMF